MPLLIVKHTELDALRAIAAQIDGKTLGLTITLHSDEPLGPKSESPEDHLVFEIADAIQPAQSGEAEYQKFLRLIYAGLDSLDMSEGEAIGSPRWASKKLTDRLKKVFPNGSVKKAQLFQTKQIYFPDGSYKATRYLPTELGLRVLAELAKRNALG